MAAIPLQGFAATTMLMCAGQAGHHPQTAPAQAGPQGHASHGEHAAHHEPAAQGDQAASQHANHHDAAASLSDLNHKCSLCAACCHNLALAAQPVWPAAPDVRQALAHDPLVRVLTPPAQLPDKPPRA